MEEKGDNQESAPKRSRSNEEIKADKDVFSSGDSGQQSPHDKEQQQQQNVNACCSSNNSNSNNHINNNSDSGLSLKMEDSCGDADITVDGILRFDNDGENTMAAIEQPKEEEEDQQMLTNDVTDNDKDMAQAEGKDDKTETTGSGSIGDSEKPTTSTTLIKRHKRNRSRNYRVAGRSLSPSSNSSTEHPVETQPEEQQELNESQPSVNAAEDPASNNATEETSPHSPYLFMPNYHESSLSSMSSSSPSSDGDDDDTDFDPILFRDRLSPGYASNDSVDSNRVKEKDEEVNKVLNKQKPPYTWCGSYELLRREHGLNGDGRTSLRNGFSYGFKNRFYASRHIVERMRISHALQKHTGCVNCLNFNRTGDLLVTGSDDARLIVWNWAANKTKHVWKSGHSANIFQSKFLPSSTGIDIISAGRDGKVRRSIVPPSGGKVQVSPLYPHSGAVHKLVICPDNPSEIISVGEDGCICSKDLRQDGHKVDMLKVLSTAKKGRKVRLFSISHHPLAPEICVSGSDQYVRVYDKRLMREPIHTMSPEHISENNSPNVTCCVYNNTGTEILATYSEDNIYLFDNKNYIPGQYLHSYKGHFNQKTIKGVNFFGPNCEYVISGSDCGNIFYWDKNTEAILNFMLGDTVGVVNCLEPHPNVPILATSGLDDNIKIWTPSAEKHPPDLNKLSDCVKRNIRRHTFLSDRVDYDDDQMPFFIRQILCRHRPNRRQRNRVANESESDNISSDDSSAPDIHSDTDDDDDDVSNLGQIACGTQ